MKRTFILAFALLFATFQALSQAPERLQPIKITSLQPVAYDSAPQPDPWGWIWRPDTSLVFTACHADTGVVGYVVEERSAPFPPFPVTGKPFHATLADVQRTEEVMAELLNLRVDSAQEAPEVFTAPRNYRYIRQYVFTLDSMGDTCVYVNCVHQGDEEPVDRRWLANVCDGDDYYWHINLNLSRRLLVEYGINGPCIVHVKGRSTEPEGSIDKVMFPWYRYRGKTYSYREYPKAVERQLPERHDKTGVSEVYTFRKGLHRYYLVTFGDEVCYGYRSNGELLFVGHSSWNTGLERADLENFPIIDTLLETVAEDMRSRGRDFSRYGQVNWIEHVGTHYVMEVHYKPPTMAYEMYSIYTFNSEGKFEGIYHRP